MPAQVKSISQPPDWWIAFEAQALDEGLSLSAWIGVCCRDRLKVNADRALADRPAANRPKKTKGPKS